MRILVTGAAGFIGSNLVDRLLSQGHTVIGIDDLSHGSLLNLKSAMSSNGFVLHQLDMTKTDLMELVGSPCDLVVHLAGLKIPRYSDGLDTLLVNSRGADAVAQFARKTGARVIAASTSDVYGKQKQIPFDENTPLVMGQPHIRRWGYAVSKMFSEQLFFAYSERYDFPVTVLRLFGNFGPNQDLTWRGGPQSTFIEAALTGAPMEIHGDGQQTRTFIYVQDTIDAILGCITLTQKRAVLNIGSDREISILDLARRVWAIAGNGGPISLSYVPYTQFGSYEDVERRVPDCSLARDLIGFSPTIDLDTGLRSTIEWQRQRREMLS